MGARRTRATQHHAEMKRRRETQKRRVENMTGESDLGKLLSGMRPELNAGQYVFTTVEGSVPSGVSPVVTVTEREGLTLVVPREGGGRGGSGVRLRGRLDHLAHPLRARGDRTHRRGLDGARRRGPELQRRGRVPPRPPVHPPTNTPTGAVTVLENLAQRSS